MATPDARDHPAASASSGGVSRSVRWAPARDGARNGPSRWSPRGAACGPVPGGAPAARAASARSRVARGAVTIVGSQAVTPHCGSAVAISHRRSGSRPRSMPTAPLHWRSMNPGATRRPVASSTAPLSGSGRSWATTSTAAMRAPVMVTSARWTPSGPTTRPPTTATRTSGRTRHRAAHGRGPDELRGPHRSNARAAAPRAPAPSPGGTTTSRRARSARCSSGARPSPSASADRMASSSALPPRPRRRRWRRRRGRAGGRGPIRRRRAGGPPRRAAPPPPRRRRRPRRAGSGTAPRHCPATAARWPHRTPPSRGNPAARTRSEVRRGRRRDGRSHRPRRWHPGAAARRARLRRRCRCRCSGRRDRRRRAARRLRPRRRSRRSPRRRVRRATRRGRRRGRRRCRRCRG